MNPINNPKTKEKINNYILDGSIKREIISKIFNAQKNDEIIEALASMWNLSMENRMKIWYHVVMNVWGDSPDDHCFNEAENIFFRKLLENKGILKKTECRKIGKIRTDRKSGLCAEHLEEMGLIDSYLLSNKEIVYLLNLNFYKGVIKDEQDKI